MNHLTQSKQLEYIYVSSFTVGAESVSNISSYIWIKVAAPYSQGVDMYLVGREHSESLLSH